jgi:polyhydroxybutyrate depolymerase
MRKRLITVAMLFTSIIMSTKGHALPAVAAPTYNPATPAPAATTSTQQALSVGGTERTYLLYVPATAPARGASLVVMLHGGGGSGAVAEKAYGWDEKADANGFLVAYPNGIDHLWNVGGGCCGRVARNNVDDVAFITAMVKHIQTTFSIDPDRIYATGMSNGGMMSYRLACDTNIFAAIGPDSATMLGGCPSPQPISVIHIHGMQDKHVPYNGDPGDGPATIDGPAIPVLNATWRAIDHCAAASVTTARVVMTSIATCPGGRAVELIAIADAGHQWPRPNVNPALAKARGADVPSSALDATSTIWAFFAAHPKSASTS